MDGYKVDLDALRTASSGIDQTLNDMESCEVRGLCGESEQYGSDAVHGAFADFCGRWQHGVDVLLEDAEGIRDALNAAVRGYTEAEHTMAEPLKQAGAVLDGGHG